jgi:hypothetical protein
VVVCPLLSLLLELLYKATDDNESEEAGERHDDPCDPRSIPLVVVAGTIVVVAVTVVGCAGPVPLAAVQGTVLRVAV